MTPAVPSPPALPDAATWRRWGIEPTWSRLIDVIGGDGTTHCWHLLDTGPPPVPGATLVCVHGNPTWAYAWKTLLVELSAHHRVIAVDQLSMGYSERVGPRRYAQRVADLDDVIATLDIDPASPLVVAAHDWGGAIAMGWAVDHPDRLHGLVLCNTGIGVPDGRAAPAIIRLAASEALRDLTCRRTSTFVEGTVRLSGQRISGIDREAFRAPYRQARHRRAIADFVGDVPLSSPHPSEHALADVAARLGEVNAPVLLAWGSRDIVFDDDFAADLAERFTDTRLQRFPEANHLVMAEADVAGAVGTWLTDLLSPARDPGDGDGASTARPGATGDATTDVASGTATHAPTGSVFSGLERRRASPDIAISDPASGTSIDFASFAARVDGVAAILIERGLQRGDRVAMLTPPGIDLIVAVYGVWRAGGVTVIADRGLGLRQLGAAISSTRPSWSIGPRNARIASALMRWAPRATRLDVSELMRAAHANSALPPDDSCAEDEAAILFTSGATGPPKGVRYLHRQLAAQRDALAATYGIGDDDRLVAAFAPFALYGPSLGVPTALTASDVTRPGTLTARVLDDACVAVSATLVFASPAALTNVVRTANDAGAVPGIEAVRLVFSAGAPVPSETLHDVANLAPSASLHTPYGMTEALPIADIDLAGIVAADESRTSAGGTGGVCVGRPVSGCEVRIVALPVVAVAGEPNGAVGCVPAGTTGEILVRAAWVSQGYLGRWHTERLARPGDGWHRTGDVGHLDDDGRLWVEGRMIHIIATADGPVTSVPVERAIERALVPRSMATAGRVAAVGIGPPGCQQIVVVIEGAVTAASAKAPKNAIGAAPSYGLADAATSAAVRAAVPHPVAAVLTVSGLPVDIRHNAKIDRGAVADRASALLAGGSAGGRRGKRSGGRS